ncbi:MAG TPA: phosphoglycolate phosphatase [Stellaceae bacterium]|nr:phosphoglycolate phosphatase [Stellaceae bacterium]
MEPFLLVFDLDGTLVDSLPDLAATANAVLRERGLPPLAQDQIKPMIGDGVPALVARALAAAGGDPAESALVLPRFIALYEANATRLSRPYPGVPETLAELRRRGYRTAVCTNKLQRAALVVLRGLGLLPLFDGVAGGDRFAVKKPEAGHLLGLIAELGGRVESAAMIGDSEVDAATARAARLPFVLMRYGYARSDLETLGAAALLDEFALLPQALERLDLGP